jgi:hypothetical protein
VKPYVFALLALGLIACGKQRSDDKSHGSSVAIGHADATIVYYAMPG